MNNPESNFLKCKSCAGHLNILNTVCPYCGEQVKIDRDLPEQVKERISWVAAVLETKLWKKKYPIFENSIRKWAISFLLLELFLFGGFYSITNSIWKSFLPVFLFSMSILFSYYKEFYYYFLDMAEKAAFHFSIEPILDEFLIGNNYYKVEFEKIINAMKGSDVSLLKKMLRPTTKSIEESDALAKVVIYNSMLCDKNAYNLSSFKCGIAYALLCFIFSLITFFILFSLDYSMWLIIIIPFPWIFLILEYTDKISIVFGLFEYEASKDFIAKEILPSLNQYCRDTETSMEEVLLKSKELKNSLQFYIK